MRAYSQWQNGVLPIEGGWADQGAGISRLVDVVAGEVSRIEEAENKT